jgi:hypothetical protein
VPKKKKPSQPSSSGPAVPPRQRNRGGGGAVRPPGPSRSPSQRRPSAKAAFEARRRRNRLLAIASVVVVVVVVAALIAVKLAGGGSSSKKTAADASPAAGTPVPAAVIAKLTSLPLATLTAAPTSGIVASPATIGDAYLSSGGKPELLFIGAEFCPICAAERWAMAIALSKFGTFSPAPGQIHSAVSDGDIPTLTFYGTTYTSKYLTFTPVETTTNQPQGDYYVTLQTPTSAQLALWKSHTSESFPWLDFAGKYDLTTAQYNPTTLEGQTFTDIASQVGDNSTTIGADIDASAKVLIQTICDITGAKPAATCSAVGNG